MKLKNFIEKAMESLLYSKTAYPEDWDIYKKSKGRITTLKMADGLEVIFNEDFEVIASYSKNEFQMKLKNKDEADNPNLFYREPELEFKDS